MKESDALFLPYFTVRSAYEGDEKTVMMYIWFGSRVRLNDREYEAPQEKKKSGGGFIISLASVAGAETGAKSPM